MKNTAILDVACATPRQRRAIAKLCTWLDVREPLEEAPMSIVEAKDLQWTLLSRLRAVRRKGNGHTA